MCFFVSTNELFTNVPKISIYWLIINRWIIEFCGWDLDTSQSKKYLKHLYTKIKIKKLGVQLYPHNNKYFLLHNLY